MKMIPVSASGSSAQNVPANYDDLLKRLINHFLSNYFQGVSDFTDLLSLFHRLFLLAQKDPPLHIIWFFAAVKFHSCNPDDAPPPGKFLVIKDLFQLLKSYSSKSCILEKMAVLAPVIYHLYHLDVNFSAEDPCLREDIRDLVEEICIYMSACSQCLVVEGEQCSGYLGVHIVGLVKVWGADQIRASPDSNFMALFFPFLNDELRQDATVCLGNLAGVVLNETLLLRLRLELCQETYEGNLQSNMLKLAIHTIKSFQNTYFLDMLFKMLSEPSLPIAALLSSKDAIILHKSLYDAVMLFDYSFYTGRWIQSLDNRSKRLAILWVLIADRAFQFARNITDPGRANSYLHAFHQSQLAIELIEWASCQEDMLQQKARPEILNPQSLIGWLLVLEDRGINVFDSNEPNIREKAETCLYLSRTDAGFCLVNMVKINFNRKRKEAMLGQIQASRVKQLKLGSSSNGDKSVLLGSSGGGEMKLKSEVKALTFDDDMIIG